MLGLRQHLRFLSRLLFNISIRLRCLKSKIKQEKLMIVGKPLFTTRQIQTKVKELADRISEDYSGKDLLVVGILKGAFMFFSDIVRAVKVPLTLDFVVASSYVKTETSGEVKIYYDVREDISDKHVLLIDDIVDSGITLNQIRERVLARRPETLKICVFLDKKERRMVDIPLDYVGFEIPNEFVVGYGLDYDGQFRNLPYISTFKKKA
jgi:hypoxanthine phosphoribosyltransferase